MAAVDPKDLFGFLIQDIARLMSRTFENQQGSIKVTRAQARVLAYVSLSEGATQSEVAALMDVQKITLTKMVDTLEKLDLVERRADPADRRIRRLYMPDAARPVLEEIWSRLADVSDIALAALPENRRKSFVQDMITVRQHLIIDTELPEKQPASSQNDISREDMSPSMAGALKS